jgi:hypothetical protein
MFEDQRMDRKMNGCDQVPFGVSDPQRAEEKPVELERGLAEIKKHLLFWKLTRAQCRIFYAQPSFRSQLETLIHDPSQQVSLQFNRKGRHHIIERRR